MRNKNNVRKRSGSYTTWLQIREGYDNESLEQLGEGSSPYSIKSVPPLLDDAYEVLEGLYYTGKLKGRQKQIVALLFDGLTNQTEMAERLNMKQGNVAVELRKIMKKILKNII